MSAASPLEALAAQAEGLEAPPVEQGAQAVQVEAATPSNGELLAGMFVVVRDLACMVLDLKSPRVTFPDNDAAQLGQAWGAVCDKRGVDLGRLMGDYGAEVAAVIITATVAKRVMVAAKAELAERAPPAAPAEPAAAAVGEGNPDGAPAGGG